MVRRVHHHDILGLRDMIYYNGTYIYKYEHLYKTQEIYNIQYTNNIRDQT